MNRQQYRTLKKMCNKHNNHILPDTDPVADYLLSNEYVTVKDSVYVVTEHGKSAMYEFRHRFMRWWIPVIISLASLAVSLLVWLFPRQQAIHITGDSDTTYTVDIHMNDRISSSREP